MFRGVVGDRHDGERGIEATIVDVDAAVHHKQIVHIMDPAVLINDRGLRIVAHAAGTGLVLAATQAGAGQERPGGYRSGLFQYGFGLGSVVSKLKCPVFVASEVSGFVNLP